MNTGAFAQARVSRPQLRAKTASALAVALFAVPLMPSCTFLKAAPDTSHYFVLSSTDASAAASPARTRADVHFGIGPVKLPGYLDNQGLVRTGAGGSIEYVADAFWAEPLKDAFARALLYRTGARIGTTHAVAYPWYSTAKVDWKVPVDVLRFEATSDGRVVLVARWSVERVADGQVVAGAQTAIEESAASDAAAIVDALSRCVDRLAEAIAEALTGPTAVPVSEPTDSKPRAPRRP